MIIACNVFFVQWLEEIIVYRILQHDGLSNNKKNGNKFLASNASFTFNWFWLKNDSFMIRM